ncbi:MAG: dihydroorotate dehydrogenase [Dethiobacteria bacterium]|jgi:dihydroorotate dehydrogenase (NAD+) catalytic subunit
MCSLEVQLGPLRLRNPVLTASGTFGFGEEYAALLKLDEIGALVVNGLTLKARQGNPPPRIIETPAGMLNAIGLQNSGLDHFLLRDMPRLIKANVTVIVNIAGDTEEEYVTLARELSSAPGIKALELNVSCPNIKKGGLQFGCSTASLSNLVTKVRQNTPLPLIVKLSPNVTDIVEIASAAEKSGADILSLINTFKGMVIDIKNKRPFLGNITGGLSGPAIRPLAVRMVYEVYRAVNIPIIGMGGIVNLEDALQFFMAGAKAIAIGTANFVEPRTIPLLLAALKSYMAEEGLSSIEEITGAAHL